MGYLKSGSQKSLMAGGLSAAVLYYVYTELPTKPVFASSIGLGKSLIFLFAPWCCMFMFKDDKFISQMMRYRVF